MRFPKAITGVHLKVLLATALILLLLPVCAMPACGAMDGMPMSGLSSLLGCDAMYYPSDAPGALIVQLLIVLFVAAIISLVVGVPEPTPARAMSFARSGTDPPAPPDDPLRGRLII
ncbi:MAG: hypothetical protein CVT60_07035 [Actinobacteria bacterium HGW-Actinobacteria-10]|jgi:O-antigen ligase|nr:MAG: hypothetical protein CVT60_07035 [Actinobacteria bacterium HGW-Actinobacteria-10]